MLNEVITGVGVARVKAKFLLVQRDSAMPATPLYDTVPYGNGAPRRNSSPFVTGKLSFEKRSDPDILFEYTFAGIFYVKRKLLKKVMCLRSHACLYLLACVCVCRSCTRSCIQILRIFVLCDFTHSRQVIFVTSSQRLLSNYDSKRLALIFPCCNEATNFLFS